MPHPWTKEGQQPGRLKGRIELRGRGRKEGYWGCLTKEIWQKLAKLRGSEETAVSWACRAHNGAINDKWGLSGHNCIPAYCT